MAPTGSIVRTIPELADLVMHKDEAPSNINILLRTLPMTQIARRLGVKRWTVWRWQTGKCTPSAEDAVLLAMMVRDERAGEGH